ncbi:MAG: ATP-binding protein [Gammaproteobacteria bacterium]|nr:ATP-binding protein [Gammaproteobacteria bacterium]
MSLNLRIIVSATLVLIVFITLTAAALNRAFIDSTESALKDKLTSQLYALLAAADINEDSLTMPSSELDALLGIPSSGIYAFIINGQGKILWQSSSILGVVLPEITALNGGEKQFIKAVANNKEFYSLSHGIKWITDNKPVAMTFNITTDLESFNHQIDKYRTTLWGWLLAMAALLLISQAVILRWGLLPLRRVGKELHLIENGEQKKIEQQYPQEIEQLTRNINQLLQQERDQKLRYRNALGDLAHSLKTPLAILQAGLQSETESKDNLQQQIQRMNSIVEYQLQRAATAGITSSSQVINVKKILERINESLQKVYRDKSLKVDIQADESLHFKGDEGDLMELVGNLLDNAYKWSKHQISVIASQQDGTLTIIILDDGPGIVANQVDDLLQRGKRADQSIDGHGIGLSIVRNILDAYQGNLTITRSHLGGAEIQITLK